MRRSISGMVVAIAFASSAVMSACASSSPRVTELGPSTTTEADAPRAQPGDRVVLNIWNEPEMSDTFTVAQDGRVILPRLGAKAVADVPIAELQDSLRAAYTEYLRNPSVEIQVLRRISVIGQVQEPGIYMADLTMGLPDLIARAGGPTEAGDPNRVTILRGSQRIDFGRAQQQAMFVASLHSGDQVIVHPRNFILRNPWAAISTAFGVLTLVRQLGLF